MIANLGYHLDCIWDQVKPKHLDIPVKNFLDWIIEMRRPTLNLSHIFWPSFHKRHRRRKPLLFYLLAPTLAGKFIHSTVEHSFNSIRNFFFGISHRLKTS